MCSAGRFITSEARWKCRFIMGRSSTVLFPQLMVLPQTWGTAGGPQDAVYPMRNQQVVPYATKIPRIPHENQPYWED